MKTVRTLGAVVVLGICGAAAYLYSQDGGIEPLWAEAAALVPFIPPPVPAEPPQAADAPDLAGTPASQEPLTLASSPEAQSAPEGPLRFAMPIDCSVGRNCLIQSFVDTDPGEGFADYRCGTLSADRNRSTKIRLPTLNDMRAGVDVRAAADGTVLRVRDGLPDVDHRLVGREAVGKSRLGNVVLLQHRDGYLTAYGHLRQGSLRVSEGDMVAAGDVLGAVGLSGVTDHPQLHFEVRRDGSVIDPFTGLAAGSGCETENEVTPLWAEAALQQLIYHPTAVLRIGFADTVLSEPAVEYGFLTQEGTFSSRSDALLLHTMVAGARAGDIARLEVFGPGGSLLSSSVQTLESNAAVRLLHTADDALSGPLDPGTYSGAFSLTRLNEGTPRLVISAHASIQVE